ncbi:Crp/Fnr family transcriptional regulator [Chitinophagaceae bacterium LB-8]|jgi:CRP-like cAMP-binding protein|uniref:Crp/Fnr family transcriptional regulator n=1 Tax=Paraflavisolibacter caeni TaxID=2982496 RepID=A0A9X2XU69_9BACT|nr:Crp/Fnr family transcriptional regulator [Paraflavisolibacter caeni]MCU7549116.1 Crp/Fnr family transcriptional regulator [Paraflavisolibacter caeni]
MQKEDCLLDRCFLCKHSLPAWKSLIELKKTTFSFKKGKKIFQEGEPVKGIFFIYEGSVKVTMNWGEQKELILRFAKAGDVLGHRGFGGDPFYPISATALEDCKVCFIDNSFLEASLIANPALSNQLMQVFAQELQKAEKRMRDLVHMEVKGRIVLALFEIIDAFGTDENGYISLQISRQDIASYAGTTYETVFKFFTELTGKGILSTSGKSIKINDPKALQSFIKY